MRYRLFPYLPYSFLSSKLDEKGERHKSKKEENDIESSEAALLVDSANRSI